MNATFFFQHELVTDLSPGNSTADDEQPRPDALTTLTVVLVGECLWNTIHTLRVLVFL
jgi:hypothetical protein